MTEEKALQVQGDTAAQDFETLKAAITPAGQTLTNSQVKLAVAYAQSVGADLFARQIYPTVMEGRLQFLASIDFLRVIAERSGQYAGQGEPNFLEGCDCQGEALVFAFPHPVWGEVPIHRKGWEHPIVRRAYFHEYVPLDRDGKNARPTWRKMPHVLLAKVSEAAGIRAAFPNDVRGLYTHDEMEQAELAPEALSAEASSIAIPDDPDKPEWAKHEISVREQPDGLRRAKRPEWYKGDVPGSTLDKLEIKAKYGRRNVAAILLGPLAEAAADAIDRLGEGTLLALDGERYEYEWEKGKPKALQLRHVGRLAINVGDAWEELAALPPAPEGPPEDVVEGEAREVPTPDETANVPAEPPKEPMAASPSSADASSTTPAEPKADTSTSAAGSGGTTPTSGDVTAAAQDTFADMLDADVDPARGGNPNVGAGWEALPVMDGPDQQAVSFEGYWASGALTDVPGAEGKMMFEGWLTSADMTQRIHVVMAARLASTQGVERLGAGEQVYVRGTWRHPRGEPMLLADTLRPA